MSTIKTNTLTGTTSAGSIVVTGEGGSTTTNLQQGLAKAFVSLNMESSNAIDDSFNHSSATDNGTGDLTHAWTNASTAGAYVFYLTVTQIQSGGIGYGYSYAGNTNARTYRTASSHRVTCGYTGNGDLHDLAMYNYTWHGDLA